MGGHGLWHTFLTYEREKKSYVSKSLVVRYLARIGVIGIEKREEIRIIVCVNIYGRERENMNGWIDYLSGIEWTPTNRIMKANTHVAMVRPTITPF